MAADVRPHATGSLPQAEVAATPGKIQIQVWAVQQPKPQAAVASGTATRVRPGPLRDSLGVSRRVIA